MKVQVSVYSWNDVDRKVKQMADAGDPPDMAQIGAYADYAAKGLLYKADDVLSIPVQADFLGQLSEAGQLRHVQYGIPFAASTRVLFYNKTLFAKRTSPAHDLGRARRRRGRAEGPGREVPVRAAARPGGGAGRDHAVAARRRSGYTDDIGTYTIDSPQNVETFTWLRDELVGKG